MVKMVCKEIKATKGTLVSLETMDDLVHKEKRAKKEILDFLETMVKLV